MGCKMNAAMTWTQLELKGLLEDEESHVYFERVKRHLGLHPFHLTDLNAALREILTATVNFYDAKIQGIILAYKNPKLLSRMGTVLYDTCYIHIDIVADFYIFRPNVGDTLKGIVNKKSQDHVGILVHKTFNVTIPRPDDDEDWPGHSIHIGQEVRFTVTCLDFKDRLPYIRGSMDKEHYLKGCRTFDETLAGMSVSDVKPKKTKFSYHEDGDLDESNDNLAASVDYSREDSGVDEKVSRKKSKKLKLENSDDAIRVKTKKKHKVETEEPVVEDEVDSYEQNESHIGDDVKFVEEFLPGKLKLKRESIDDVIHTKKKRKKSKVKAEEILSESTEYDVEEVSHRHIPKIDISDEDFLPRKSKKLKKENIEGKIDSKNKTKAEIEVEILHSEGDFDSYKANGNRNVKSESEDERNRKKKKHIIKTEVLSSDTESDTERPKQRKKMKIESNIERSSKKYKVKAEISPSETEYDVDEAKQSVKTKRKLSDQKSKRKHKIKAEELKPETYD